jgi:NodT family efflux transporter outer membrane factor (OMF) lipoprotein
MNYRTNKKRRLWAAVLVPLMLIAGCKVGPNYEPPTVTSLPEQWQNASDGRAEDPNTLAQWWLLFNDPVLTELIEEASQSSFDLQAALSRIAESRALRNAVAGQYAPTLDATGFYRRSRESENGMNPMMGGQRNDLYSAGFDAAWEIDFFGRIGRGVESAQAALEASVEDYRAIRTSLMAEVGRNYIELRSAQKRIQYAQSNVEIQRQTVDLTQGRFKSQLSPRLDVSQAMLNLANTESEIPSLRIAETAALNRLSVLLGRMPVDLQERLKQPGDMPEAPAGISAGIPAEVLRRRPDIRRAERQLAAQTAQIGAAQANLYPMFSLTGTLALEATDFSNLGDMSSRSYSFGPGFRWNLFNGNQYRSLVQAEEARTAQVLAAYESSVLLAVEEVENALIGFVQEGQRLEALDRSVAAAQESVQLVDTLYRSGLTDFQNVLIMQRTLSLQQDRAAISRGQMLQQAIALYKALGGGWEEPLHSETQDSQRIDERQARL